MLSNEHEPQTLTYQHQGLLCFFFFLPMLAYL